MLAADEKQTALQTIQAVVTAIAQNHYAAIPTLLSVPTSQWKNYRAKSNGCYGFRKQRLHRFPKRSLISMKTKMEKDLKSIIG